MYVDEKGDLAVDLNIVSWLFQNKSLHRVNLGSLQKRGSLDFKLLANPKALEELDELKKVRKLFISPLVNLLTAGLLSWDKERF